MHVVRGARAKDQWGDDLTSWASVADVVTLIAGETEGLPWLCMSTSGHRHLVLELPARDDGRPQA
jgi:hypothetical protein